MGQGESQQVQLTPEQLGRELAVQFASKCFTQLELYCFKEVFSSLADSESELRYWSEGTLCRYLELPDVLSGAGQVVYQMATFLGAFPFPSQAPSIMTFEAMVKVVVIMTERYSRVLKKGNRDRLRLFYSSLAVFDRKMSEGQEERLAAKEKKEDPLEEAIRSVGGFAVDQAVEDDDEAEDDEDDLALAALESLDSIEVIGLGEKQNMQHSIIPFDNLLHLIELLLLVAPLEAQESLSKHAERLSDEAQLKRLRRCAKAILRSFSSEGQPGISFRTFKQVVPNTLPYMFNGFNPLFEHFLFEKEFDLSKRKRTASTSSTSTRPSKPTPQQPALLEPLIPYEGEILNHATLSQLSFFIKGEHIFRHLVPLYSGSDAGFSMGSFEKSVFNWHAPTLLLVSGTLLPSTPSNSRERAFSDSLPPKRFPNSTDIPSTSSTSNTSTTQTSQTVTYGAYIPTPWKQTHKTPFGTSDTLLFQLHPTHDVFRASTLLKNYTTYVTPPSGATAPGINFGSPLHDTYADRTANTTATGGTTGGTHRLSFSSHAGPGSSTMGPSYARQGMLRRSSVTSPTSPTSHAAGPPVPLGPVSLYLDDSLEYAVFTHSAAGGGSFHTSGTPGRRARDWQDRFEIEALEVWGCGGDVEVERQRKAVEFEEREARLRREINIGGKFGDLDADRELLRMAGLVGHGEQGGSM